MNREGFLRRRARSFGHAWRGWRWAWREQTHFRIHVLGTAAVAVAAWLSAFTRLEWAVLLTITALVWTAELLNTAVEYVVDLAHPAPHPLAGKAKDVAAGAVLASAMFAILAGLLLFGPRVAAWFAR